MYRATKLSPISDQHTHSLYLRLSRWLPLNTSERFTRMDLFLFYVFNFFLVQCIVYRGTRVRVYSNDPTIACARLARRASKSA